MKVPVVCVKCCARLGIRWTWGFARVNPFPTQSDEFSYTKVQDVATNSRASDRFCWSCFPLIYLDFELIIMFMLEKSECLSVRQNALHLHAMGDT